jgi:hypothetical protein
MGSFCEFFVFPFRSRSRSFVLRTRFWSRSSFGSVLVCRALFGLELDLVALCWFVYSFSVRFTPFSNYSFLRSICSNSRYGQANLADQTGSFFGSILLRFEHGPLLRSQSFLSFSVTSLSVAFRVVSFHCSSTRSDPLTESDSRFDSIASAERCINSLRRYRNLHPTFSKVCNHPYP